MFELAATALDLTWAVAADAELGNRFRTKDGLDEAAYLDCRNQLAQAVFDILRTTIQASNPPPPAGADFEPLRAEVERQCELMWCAALDAHRSPDFRLDDGRLDDELHRVFRRNVRTAGAGAILNARPGGAESSTTPDLH